MHKFYFALLAHGLGLFGGGFLTLPNIDRIASIQKLASGTCAAKWDFTGACPERSRRRSRRDGDGVRTAQSYTPYTDGQPGTPVITRYYFGGAYEITGSAWKKYYAFAGQTVAMRDASGFKYFLSDHLGSVSVVLSATGTVLEQQRYLPFGQARVMPPYASVTSTDFTYTGQRNLPDTGLMDYRARFYSPALGRFIQPDTIIPDLANSQDWNRYAYVYNNPIMRNDPTGHFGPIVLFGVAVPAIVVLAVAAVILVATYAIMIDNRDEIEAAIDDGLYAAGDMISDGKKALANEWERWQENTRNKKQLESLETSSNNSGDNYLGSGYGYKPPKCGWACWLTIGGAATYVVRKVYCGVDDDNCKTTPTKPITKPTSTSTLSPTLTPTSPQTSTPTVTSTPTWTPTATSTPTRRPTATSTPTRRPNPVFTPFRRRHGGVFEE